MQECQGMLLFWLDAGNLLMAASIHSVYGFLIVAIYIRTVAFK